MFLGTPHMIGNMTVIKVTLNAHTCILRVLAETTSKSVNVSKQISFDNTHGVIFIWEVDLWILIYTSDMHPSKSICLCQCSSVHSTEPTKGYLLILLYVDASRTIPGVSTRHFFIYVLLITILVNYYVTAIATD
jgi:hypothetical protein